MRDRRLLTAMAFFGRSAAALAPAAFVAVLVWLAWETPVLADDCSRDPFNANDCLRTPGYAQALATVFTGLLALLVNGGEVLRTVLQQVGGGTEVVDVEQDDWEDDEEEDDEEYWRKINERNRLLRQQRDLQDKQRREGEEEYWRNLDQMVDTVQDEIDTTKREYLKSDMEADEAIADIWNLASDRADYFVKSAEWIKSGADRSVDLLATIIGPAGTPIKTIYTFSTDFAGGVATAGTTGDPTEIIKGGIKGLSNVGYGMLTDKLTSYNSIKYNNKIPGLKDYNPGTNWGNVRVGFVKDALLGNNVSDPVNNMVTNVVIKGAKNSLQGWIQGKLKGEIIDKPLIG